MSPRNRFSSFYKEREESNEGAKKSLNCKKDLDAILKMPRESESLNKYAKPKKKSSDSSDAKSKMLRKILDLIIDEGSSANRHKRVSHNQGLKCLAKEDLKEENIDLLIYKLENCLKKSVVHKLENVLDLLKQIKTSRMTTEPHRCSPEKHFDDESIEDSLNHEINSVKGSYLDGCLLTNKCQQTCGFNKPVREESFKKPKKLVASDSGEIDVNISSSPSTEGEHTSLEVEGSFMSETSSRRKLKNGCGDCEKCSVAVQCSQDIKYETMSTNTFKERSFLCEEIKPDYVSSEVGWHLNKSLLDSTSNVSIITTRKQLISATEGKTQFNWERTSNFHEDREQRKTFSSGSSAVNKIQHYEIYDPSTGFNEISKSRNYRGDDLKRGMHKVVDLEKSESCIKFLKVRHAYQARTRNPESKLRKNHIKKNTSKRGVKVTNHRWCEEERNKKVLNDSFDFKLTGKYKDRKCSNKKTCNRKVSEYKKQNPTCSTGCEYFSGKARTNNTLESKCGGDSVVDFGSESDLKFENKVETKATNVSSSIFNETKNNVNYCRAKLFSSNCNSNYVDEDEGEKPEKVVEYFMFPEKKEDPENEAELVDKQGSEEKTSIKSPSEVRSSKTDSKTDESKESSSKERLLVKVKRSIRSSISDFFKRKASKSKSSTSLKGSQDEVKPLKPIKLMKTGKTKKIIDFLEKELDIEKNDTFVLVFTNRDNSKVKDKRFNGSRNSIKVLNLNKMEEKDDVHGKPSYNELNRRTISFDTKTTTIGVTADDSYDPRTFGEDFQKMKSKLHRNSGPICDHTKSDPAKEAPWCVGGMSRYRPLDSCQSKTRNQPEMSFWQKSKQRGGMKCQIDISKFALKENQLHKSNLPKDDKCSPQEQTAAASKAQESLACVGQNQCGDGCVGCVLRKKPRDDNYVINLEPSKSKEICLDLYCPFVPHVFYEERRC